MKRFFIVQHCQSEHHINGLSGGWTDTPLTSLGIEQAKKVALSLENIVQGRSVLYSSDLLRAKGTAEEISRVLNVDIILEAGLRERNYGIATGKTREWFNQNGKAIPDENRLDHRPIEGAETWREFYARITLAMENLCESDVDNIIIVSHGGAKDNIIAWWLHIPVEAMGSTTFRGKPGAITSMTKTNGFNRLDVLSDVTHLI